MTESYHESEQNKKNLPIEAGDVSPYVKAIDEFDVSQHDLISAVSDYFSDPTNKNSEASLQEAINGITVKFSNCVSEVHKNANDINERANSIAQLMLGEEKVHLEAWEALIPTLEYETVRYKKENLVSAIHEVYSEADGDEKDIRRAITKFFITGLQRDLGRALEHVSDDTGELDLLEEIPSKRKEILRTLGKNALDIAKVSLGVAGGILAAKYITKRTQ